MIAVDVRSRSRPATTRSQGGRDWDDCGHDSRRRTPRGTGFDRPSYVRRSSRRRRERRGPGSPSGLEQGPTKPGGPTTPENLGRCFTGSCFAAIVHRLEMPGGRGTQAYTLERSWTKRVRDVVPADARASSLVDPFLHPAPWSRRRRLAQRPRPVLVPDPCAVQGARPVRVWQPARNSRTHARALSVISAGVGTGRCPNMAALCGSMIIMPRSIPAASSGSSTSMTPA